MDKRKDGSLSAIYAIKVPSCCVEQIEYLAKENGWTPEQAIVFAFNTGKWFLCAMTKNCGPISESVPAQALEQLAGEMCERGWEVVAPDYQRLVEEGIIG